MGNLEVDETMLEVKKSNIKNAGMGLFARVDIPPKVKLGYFGGTIECSMCRDTISKRLVKQNNVMLGEEYMNELEDELVMLNLTRSFIAKTDGLMWFINSSSWNKKTESLDLRAGACFDGSGLTAEHAPIVAVYTTRLINAGEEIYVPYIKNHNI